METKVKFNRKKTKEQALLGNSGTIYFTTDKSIVLDGESYGGVQEVTLKDTPAGVVDDVEYVSKGEVTTLLALKIDTDLNNIGETGKEKLNKIVMEGEIGQLIGYAINEIDAL